LKSHAETYAHSIIDSLYQCGIDKFFIAPGSRSTPLVLAAARHKGISTEVFYDERALCFMAIGYAKASKKIPGIIVTSGSALGNLLPGVMEAFQGNVPLVALTADRPNEMVNCSDNQTIEQKDLFSSFVCHKLLLPTANKNMNISYLSSEISLACHKSQKELKPIQINCPFEKPLSNNQFIPPESATLSKHYLPDSNPSDETIEKLANKLKSTKGLIIISELPKNSDITSVYQLARQLGWPVFADPLSFSCSFNNVENQISYFELLLKANISLDIDTILQFGNRFISLKLLEKIKTLNLKNYVHISPYSSFYDPIRKVSDFLQCKPSVVATKLLKITSQRTDSILLKDLQHIDQTIEKMLLTYFESAPFSESWIVHNLPHKEFSSYFFANSMPIRECLHFFHPKKSVALFANRGCSGIDGNISTTIGIDLATGENTLAIIGDQAALHDLNSLSFLSEKKKKPTLFIFNNKGGGIFSHLPIKDNQLVFSKFFQATHCLEFDKIALQFNLSYCKVATKENFKKLLSKKLPCFVEFQTDTKTNVNVHKAILEKTRELVCQMDQSTFQAEMVTQ